MPRKKKGSTPIAETVQDVELPEKELTLSSLYEMICEVIENQQKFYDETTKHIKGLMNTFADNCTKRSDNLLLTMENTKDIFQNTCTGISNCLGVFGKNLNKLEKQFEEFKARGNTDTDTENYEKKPRVIVKGMPTDIAEESLKDYIGKMFATLNEEVKDFTAERIIINDKPGPVKVHLNSEEDVIRILRSKHTLKESEEFRTVYVCPYMSKQHRRTDFNIRQMAKVIPGIRFSGGRVRLK